MKTKLKKPTGTIYLTVRTEFLESELIPKLVQLLDEDQNIVIEKWVSRAFEVLGPFSTGKYILRLRVPSGTVRSKVTYVFPNEQTYAEIDLTGISPHEDMEWAYLADKNLSRQIVTDKAEIEYPFSLDVGFVRLIEGEWMPDLRQGRLLKSPLTITDDDGVVAEFESPGYLTALEIRYPGHPRKTVSLPPGNRLKVLIRPVLNREERKVSTLDIMVSSNNWKAEALLSLLKTGAIHDAETLMSHRQASELIAEELLLEKRFDHAAAAIGGYYLLRANCFKRLHNWPKNLADWFPEMPDGAVIYATQLINNQKPRKAKIEESREYFVKAIGRGLPVYTEGFRLLLDGVTQLYYHSKKQDIALGSFLRDLKYYQKRIDWNQNITTLNELFPDIEERPGKPDELLAPQEEEFEFEEAEKEEESAYRYSTTKQYLTYHQ
jgi:hypothetical protein